jgi:hypothetical protein
MSRDTRQARPRAGAWIETFQWHVRDYVKKSPPRGGMDGNQRIRNNDLRANVLENGQGEPGGLDANPCEEIGYL